MRYFVAFSCFIHVAGVASDAPLRTALPCAWFPLSITTLNSATLDNFDCSITAVETVGFGSLRLRGGRAPYTKGRPGKDPLLLDPEHVFDALFDGQYSKLMRDDSEEDEGRTEDALQEQDPNEEELRRRKKKRRSLDDSLGQGVASSARDVSTSLAHDSDEEEYSDETMLEIASQACLEGDFDAATRGFEECLSADANDVDAMNNYATMLFEHKLDVDKAEVLLRRALEIAPNSTTIMGNLALLLLDHRRRQDDAEQLFQRILGLEPDDVAGLNNYALFMQDVRKNYTAAEQLLLRAERADPTSIATVGNLVHLLHHHFPDRQFVEDRKDVIGPHYAMTGLELARALTLRAMRMDGSHPWVQDNAARYLSKDSEAYRRYRARYPGYRPGNYHKIPGAGVARSPSSTSLA